MYWIAERRYIEFEIKTWSALWWGRTSSWRCSEFRQQGIGGVFCKVEPLITIFTTKVCAHIGHLLSLLLPHGSWSRIIWELAGCTPCSFTYQPLSGRWHIMGVEMNYLVSLKKIIEMYLTLQFWTKEICFESSCNVSFQSVFFGFSLGT